MSKLIRIPYNDLPDFNAITESYKIRYRLKSDDGNRTSAWSPIYEKNPNFVFDVDSIMILEKESGYNRAVWKPIKIYTQDGGFVQDLGVYDVWVRYSDELGDRNGDIWEYQERVFGTSLEIFKGFTVATVKYISVEIYRPTVQSPTMRRRMFDVYQDNVHVDLVKSEITFDIDIDFETGEEIKYNVYEETGDTPIAGLISGASYFVRRASGNTISLHSTKNDAINNVNREKLSSHPNTVGYFSAASCTLCNYLLYSYYYRNL